MARHLVRLGLVAETIDVRAAIVLEIVGTRAALGGFLGSFLGHGPSLDRSSGLAAELPRSRVWVAVSTSGVIVCAFGTLIGSPGDLLLRYEPGELVAVRSQPFRATRLVTLTFSDGTSAERELARSVSFGSFQKAVTECVDPT